MPKIGGESGLLLAQSTIRIEICRYFKRTTISVNVEIYINTLALIANVNVH